MQMPDRRMFFQINWGLVFITILLFAVGMVNLYSASGSRIEGGFVLSPFYQRQLVWGLIGLCVMVTCMLIDYRRIERLAVPCYVIVLILLMLVPIVGKTVYGAKRWIDLGVMNLQPSELAKFAPRPSAATGSRWAGKDSGRCSPSAWFPFCSSPSSPTSAPGSPCWCCSAAWCSFTA